jgi:hypothetical protein
VRWERKEGGAAAVLREASSRGMTVAPTPVRIDSTPGQQQKSGLQFIESSFFGVRAAVYELARGDDDPRFLLLPMIHIGAPSYYQGVRAKLSQCEIILFEGVRSLRGAILALSYGIVARRKGLGLVTQRSALPLRDLPAKRIHGDVTGAQFAQDWGRVPWHWRAALYLGAPLFGTYLYLTATRRSLGKHLSTDDLPSREEVMFDDRISEAIVHARDRKVIESIHAILQDQTTGRSLTAIMYGAGHMGAISTVLMESLRYRVVKAEWLSVFDYDDE